IYHFIFLIFSLYSFMCSSTIFLILFREAFSFCNFLILFAKDICFANRSNCLFVTAFIFQPAFYKISYISLFSKLPSLLYINNAPLTKHYFTNIVLNKGTNTFFK